MNVKPVKKFLRYLSKNRSTIAFSMGVLGFWKSAYDIHKNTPIAEAKVEARKKELGVTTLPVAEYIRLTGKEYGPVLFEMVISTAAITFGVIDISRINAGLAAALGLSQDALKRYKESVTEVLDEPQVAKINEVNAEKSVTAAEKESAPVKTSNLIVAPGDIKCIDMYTGLTFYSSPEKLKAGVNEANRQMLNEDYITVNELYSQFGDVPATKMGEQLGFRVEDGLIELHLYGRLDENDMPCMAIEISPDPSLA